ncbi:MAG TPA: hydantoinase/oxoprolinase family protein [Gemmatimonadaceae bacterium]|jgi:probable H4MPT-linked C1 transfer pathway protein|nr:hydantoinase/oxoprolinase family protein [Gemmatimonadaceae bacterium]
MVTGWDIGGANIKVARAHATQLGEVRSVPFSIQHTPQALAPTLQRLARELGTLPSEAHGVTMTAELSQYFRTKREGVRFVLDAVASAFPEAAVHTFTVSGNFVSPEAGREIPLSIAAANWAATATLLARRCSDTVLIDIGSTTTDIIPVCRGIVAAQGRTDLGRLSSAELLYVGAVRTPLEAIVHNVALEAGSVGIAAEAFALTGDVYVWLGDLRPASYCAPTPDGRPATREFVRERLARAVCADREMLSDSAISAIASNVAAAQLDRTAQALTQVLERNPSITSAVTAGVGSFIAERAALRCGLDVTPFSAMYGEAAHQAAPAAAVALLLELALAS